MLTKSYKMTVAKNHTHVAYLDVQGNGTTTNVINHVHPVKEFTVGVVNNHAHLIIRS